jgi:hypothetical protein
MSAFLAFLTATGDIAVLLFGLALTGVLFLAFGLFALLLVLRTPKHDPYAEPFGDFARRPRRRAP